MGTCVCACVRERGDGVAPVAVLVTTVTSPAEQAAVTTVTSPAEQAAIARVRADFAALPPAFKAPPSNLRAPPEAEMYPQGSLG